MKTKIISELEKRFGSAQSREELAAQKQASQQQRCCAYSKVE
jgi:hypothetical protein